MKQRLSYMVVTSGFLLAATPTDSADAGIGRFFKKAGRAITGTANKAVNTVAKAPGTVAAEATTELKKTTKFSVSSVNTVTDATVAMYKTSIDGAEGTYNEARTRVESFERDMERFGEDALWKLLNAHFNVITDRYGRVLARLTKCAQALVATPGLTTALTGKAMENKTLDSETVGLVARFRDSAEFKGCVRDSLQSTDLTEPSPAMMGGIRSTVVRATPVVTETVPNTGKALPATIDDQLSKFMFKSFSFGMLLEAAGPVLGGEGSIGFGFDLSVTKPAYTGWVGLEGLLVTNPRPSAAGSFQAAFWTSDAKGMAGPSITFSATTPISSKVDLGTQVYFSVPSQAQFAQALKEWIADPIIGKGGKSPDIAKLFPLQGIGSSIGMGVGLPIPTLSVGGGYTWTLPNVK